MIKRPFSQQIPSYWNDPAYLDYVVASIRSLKLPPMTKEVEQEADPEALAKLVLKYFRNLKKGFIDGTFCESLIVNALQNCKFHCGAQIPWTDVIDACIEYKLKCLDTQVCQRSSPIQSTFQMNFTFNCLRIGSQKQLLI